CIIESKSFKLYLNSLNQARFESVDQVQQLLGRDLSAVAGAPVVVQLSELGSPEAFSVNLPEGRSLDGQEIEVEAYSPAPELLQVHPSEVVEETVYSDLFKSNCPVTGQPDWGTVVLRYRGPR